MSLATDEWFWDWAVRHVARFPRGDWPPLDNEFWNTFRHLFVTKGITESVADEASTLLFEDPPSFLDAHPRALLLKVRQIWRESEVRSSPVPCPVTAAENAAWDRAAEAHWSRISEEDREEARQMVRERLPELAKHRKWLEGLARGWAYDPTMVAGLPPAPEPHSSQRGPRRIFSGEASPVP